MPEIGQLFAPLILAHGQIVPNRLCQAAMEESLAGAAGQVPDVRLLQLNEQWAKGDSKSTQGGSSALRQSALDITLPETNWLKKVLAALAVMTVTKVQLNRMAKSKSLRPNTTPVLALIGGQLETKWRTRQDRRWCAI